MNNTICYFDPYGNEPDYTLPYMSQEAINEYGQQPILSNMLKQCGYLVVYNIEPLQKHVDGNAICVINWINI
jgi:hypothetical protein